MAILDYAVHEPAQPRTKEVVYYLNEKGEPATQDSASTVVTTNVSINERIGAGLKQPYANQMNRLESQMSPTQGDRNDLSFDDLQALQDEFDALKILRPGGLLPMQELLASTSPWKLHVITDAWDDDVKNLQVKIDGVRNNDPAIKAELAAPKAELGERNASVRSTPGGIQMSPRQVRARVLNDLSPSKSALGLVDPDLPTQTTPVPGLGGILQLQQSLNQVTPQR